MRCTVWRSTGDTAMFTVTVKDRSGNTYTENFTTDREALRFCREEVKWESTSRVVCDAIGFDEHGDFTRLVDRA
jgi:hypothetical protein